MRYEVIYTGAADLSVSKQLRRISEHAAGTHEAHGRKEVIMSLAAAVKSSEVIFICFNGGSDTVSDVCRAIGLDTRTLNNVFDADGEDVPAIVPVGAKTFVGDDYIYHGCVSESGQQSIIFLPLSQENMADVFETYIFPFLGEKYGVYPETEMHEKFEEVVPISEFSSEKAAGQANVSLKADVPRQYAGYADGTEIDRNDLASEFDYEDELDEEDEDYEDEDDVTAMPAPRRSKGRRIGVGIAVFILIVAVLGAAFYIAYDKFLAAYAADSAYSRLRQDYGKASADAPMEIQDKFGELYTVNSNVAGWLKIEGTNIDHPVAQLEGLDNDYYKNHLFDGTYNKYGSLHMSKDYKTEQGAVNRNTVIRGNNLSDSRMLSDLTKYTDIDFYKSHYTVSMNTIYEDKEWVIFAAAIMDEVTSDFTFVQTEFADDNAFAAYIAELKALSFLVTPVEVQPTDEILTLITNYNEKMGTSIAVIAKRVDIGTGSGYDVSSSTINESALQPQHATANNPFVIQAAAEVDETSSIASADSSLIESGLLSSLLPSSASELSSSSRAVSSTSASRTSSAAAPSSKQPAPSSDAPSETVPLPSPPDTSNDPDPSGDIQFTVKNQFTGATVTGSAVDIVAQVIEAEMGSSFNLEALKAQAVATYTYLYYSGAAGSSAPSAPMKTAGARSIQAAHAVAGQTLTYNGKICNSLYFAMSAGKTTRSGDVWGGDMPYLVSVDSSVDSQCSNFQTTRTYSAAIIADCVNKQYGVDLYTVADKSMWISPTYDATGLYVKTVSFGGLASDTGYHLRTNVLTSARVGSSNVLRSHAFTVSYDAASDAFTFVVKGYGHGVGMSQEGANIYAANGWSYEQILNHYYTGAVIAK